MKINVAITFIGFVLSLIACTKTSSNADEVFVRIENATAEDFSNLTLNTTEFGSIKSGDTSKYLLCKKVLPIAFANDIAINNNYIYIVDVVPTPYLKNGNYLMKVISDTLPYRYQASFNKE
jgi:hypothetical protein